MRKILIITALTALLSGCASLQTFEKDVSTAFGVLTSAKVTPQQIIIAGNTFDALEATATQYLLYCKGPGLGKQVCALGNRKPVVKAVRAGRAARTALEPYATSGQAGPKAVYDVLVSAIGSLQSSSITTGN